MQNKLLLSFILLLSIANLSAQKNLSPEITSGDLKHYLYYLASDSLEGRFPGSKGGNAAASFIASGFKSSGLNLYKNNGMQSFEVLTRQELGKKNSLSVDGKKLKVETDFMPFPFSGNGKAAGDVVFAGYGIDIKTDTFLWNDYAGADVKGKIVLLLRGTPESQKYKSLFDNYSDDIVKAIYARDKGAAAVLLVSGEKYDPSEKFPQMNLRESAAGIPVFLIKREIASKLLGGKIIGDIENQIAKDLKPGAQNLNANVALTSEIVKIKAVTHNVIGFVYAPDTSKVKNYVVIGAHYDHLGMGGMGASSRIQDTVAVHNGADDNASGVSVLMELAAKFQHEKSRLKQNLIFVAFGAEEMGILGSKFFVENCPVDPKAIKAMINLDMVGRLKEDTLLQVNGTGTSKEAVSIVTRLNEDYKFNLRMAPEGYGPSDHAAFYAKNIPVFFISTGAHTDYHTPSDDSEKINFEGMEKVARFTGDIISQLTFTETLLTFQEAGPQQSTGTSRRFRVTLGIMPDVNGTVDNGLLVEFVTKGKPAYNGGMQKGDIITSVDGKPVKNIQDYMVRLSQLKAGQSVNVEVMRNNKKELLIIQL